MNSVEFNVRLFKKMNLPSSAQHNAPIRDRIPERVQIINDIPTDPEYKRTPLGDTNMPDPTIIPIMIEAPSIRPNWRFNFVSELWDTVSEVDIIELHRYHSIFYRWFELLHNVCLFLLFSDDFQEMKNNQS